MKRPTRRRYQAYAWDGEKYCVISIPIYLSDVEAIQVAEAIIKDKNHNGASASIREHYKEKPIIAKELRF